MSSTDRLAIVGDTKEDLKKVLADLVPGDDHRMLLNAYASQRPKAATPSAILSCSRTNEWALVVKNTACKNQIDVLRYEVRIKAFAPSVRVMKSGNLARETGWASA